MARPVVLLCPCHYLFDELTEGSEFSWAFHIGDGISRRLPGSVVVTGARRLNGAKPYRVLELQPQMQRRDLLRLGKVLQFNWQYSRISRRLVRTHEFNIVHHVLPFAIANTFNLSWLVGSGNQSHAKLVLGPVQAPLEIQDDDLVNSWRSALDNPIRRFMRPILANLSRQTIRRADRIIATNERSKALLIAAGARADSVCVIPPGIHTDRFQGQPRRDRQQTDRVELLAVGFLLKRKAIDLIISAVSELVIAGRNIRLTIVGDGPQRQALQYMTAQCRLDSYVEFVGAVPNSQIADYYNRADIFVNMSRAEAFSVVCLEAMASGLAIVASPAGGFSDAIESGINGSLVSPNDHSDLAAKICDLVDNQSKMLMFGSRARQDAVAKFDWNGAIIPKYLEIYEELVRDQ
jgi:glycosyltransferase involved in cell wall biosynthesis